MKRWELEAASGRLRQENDELRGRLGRQAAEMGDLRQVIEDQTAVIAELRAEVAGLKKQVEELRRAGHRQANRFGRSGIYRADMRLAARASPVYAELVELVRQLAQVFVDETGWRIGTLSAWLWVFCGSGVTVYTIRRSRGHEVVGDSGPPVPGPSDQRWAADLRCGGTGRLAETEVPGPHSAALEGAVGE